VKHQALLAAACLMAASCHAGDLAGTVKTVKGQVHIERGTERHPVNIGSSVYAQDRILSGPNSAVGITLKDSTLLTAGPNSTLVLSQYAFDRSNNTGHMDTLVQRGTLAVVSGQMAKSQPDKVVFRTSSVTLGVRGTEFIIDASAGSEQKTD
jgi:hypothetical protein